MYRENFLPPFFPPHFLVLFKKNTLEEKREKNEEENMKGWKTCIKRNAG